MFNDFSDLFSANAAATVCNFIFGALVLLSCVSFLVLSIINAISHSDKINTARFVLLGCEILFLILELMCGFLAYQDAFRALRDSLSENNVAVINMLSLVI